MRNIIFGAALLLLTACGGRELDVTEVDEIPPGPGLFTGSDGAIVISPSDID